MPLYQTLTLTFLTLIFTACGGGDSSSGSTTAETIPPLSTLTPSSQNVALDNMGNNIQKSFNGYEIKVLSDKELTESDRISKDTVAIYGTINQKPTNALLKLNSNYRDSNLTVEIYKENKLLATKKALSLTNQIAVDFGQIEIE